MRRSDREMSSDWAWGVVEKGEYGVLSSLGPDQCPYAVPLSYVVMDKKIYFHSADKGRKIDNLNFCSKVSFVVVGRTKPVYLKNFTTYFESAIISGQIFFVEDMNLKTQVLLNLCKKYLPDYLDFADKAISQSISRTKILGLEVETITGKAKRPKEENYWL